MPTTSDSLFRAKTQDLKLVSTQRKYSDFIKKSPGYNIENPRVVNTSKSARCSHAALFNLVLRNNFSMSKKSCFQRFLTLFWLDYLKL